MGHCADCSLREEFVMLRPYLRHGGLAAVALLSLTLTGCATIESVKAEIPKQPPDANLTGIWTSSEWQNCYLNQSGADLSGRLGDYIVDGLITGKDVYLFLSYGTRVYYTMKLSATPTDDLIGYYFDHLMTFEQLQNASRYSRRPTSFRKSSEAALPQ
jgi:hypothetical protein